MQQAWHRLVGFLIGTARGRQELAPVALTRPGNTADGDRRRVGTVNLARRASALGLSSWVAGGGPGGVLVSTG